MAQRMYINVDGEYGMTTGGWGDSWDSPKELLDELDRLGIWQTVLEFKGSSNSLYCAKTLLKDVEKLGCPRERIIPCFSLAPGMLFQTGAMDEMIEIMKNNRPFCVSLRPGTCCYALKAIEEVLERISFLNPVVLIRTAEIEDKNKGADDLVWLAERFPNMRFVLCMFASKGWPFIYNVMRRTKNVYADAARMLISHSIENACEHFGEDRVVFGQSLRSGNGASMGAIEYAEISEEAKDKIRCRNFINLFSDPKDRERLTANLRCVEDHIKNSLWRPFINGEGMKDVEIYDVHTHLGYTSPSGYIRNLTFESQIAQFEKDMERFNIKKIVSAVTGIADPIACHEEKEAAVKGKGDRFKGYVRYDPNHEEVFTDEYLQERFATGYYVGFKSLPHYMKTDIRDKKYERMFQYAHDHHLPILLHTDNQKGSPMACAEMAARYPNAKVILGHTGLFDEGRAQAERLAKNPNYNNVYFEFCGSFLTKRRRWSQTLEHIDYHRVLFGTDAPILSNIWELSRLLSEDISDKALIAILGQNAKELFGF